MNVPNCVHRIAAADMAASQAITSLLAELEDTTLAADTRIGRAMSFVVSTWRLEADGSFLIQFSPLLAERLNNLHVSGIELLQSARQIASPELRS